MKVAYLINQYPAVSHTFIRREIEALEGQGVAVLRFALRGWDLPLVDAHDRAERERTHYLLRGGAWPLLQASLGRLWRAPRRFVAALALALRMARASDRPWPVHLAYLAEACALVRALAGTGASHVHAHFATNPAEVAMLAHALGGPPFSFTAHGSDIMDRPAQVGLPHTVGRAAFVVAVCAYGRSQIMRWVPQALWPRLQVVRCGLEPGYGRDARALDPATRRLVCVGRLSREKGPLLLVEAARVLAAAGERFDMVLAGDGPLRAEIERAIARHGLAAQVRVTGWLDADGVREQVEQARALVVSSLSEGLPVVIMEAMALGRPVVAPYLAGIPELVQPGATGWLYPAGDTQALAGAIMACLAAPDAMLAHMGSVARERVWQAHDARTEAAKLAALFAAATPTQPDRS